MTRKASTTTGANDRAEDTRTESLNPAGRTKPLARPATTPLTAEPASKGSGPSRRDQLIRLLMTKNGTDIAAIGAKFGWLPHTTRAALSGLRKAGHTVVTEKLANGKPTRYRIALQTTAALPDGSAHQVTEPSAPDVPSEQGSRVGAPEPADRASGIADEASGPAAGAA